MRKSGTENEGLDTRKASIWGLRSGDGPLSTRLDGERASLRRKEVPVTLRIFHLVFVLICMVAADMFGAWAVWQNAQTPETSLLVCGVLSFLVGFGLIAYAIWFVRKADRTHLQ